MRYHNDREVDVKEIVGNVVEEESFKEKPGQL
jgi:hypothetical protein